ncbi:MAG: hypothetical protein GY809_26410, partial [Planctomycetes bacterium]|nr:hypothetical protein [Planctomycetota bacterium]
MSRKLAICVCVGGLFLITAAQGASIIWVDEGAADSFPTWQALLEGAGHTVTQMSDMRTLDQGKIDAMNAADLVIVG